MRRWSMASSVANFFSSKYVSIRRVIIVSIDYINTGCRMKANHSSRIVV